MLPPLRPLYALPGADDFATDVAEPLEHTVEIPRVPKLPPVPAPRPRPPAPRPEAVHRYLWLAAAVILGLVFLAVGLAVLDAAVEVPGR